jgi:hypothetical protein
MCSLIVLCTATEVSAQIHPSLRETWNTAHLSRFDQTQTTVDTLFEIVKHYKTATTLKNAYQIDLTAEDVQMLRQFAQCFTVNKDSYKKKHSFWFIRIEYYKRLLQASRAQKLIHLLSEADYGVRSSGYARGSAARERFSLNT